jgi:hypothetical protein
MKQTSVDWLQRKITETYINEGKLPLAYTLDLVKQAKEKNEEEMMNFANWCRIHDNKYPNQIWSIQQLFDKYRKTYGSQKTPDTSSPNIKNK